MGISADILRAYKIYGWLYPGLSTNTNKNWIQQGIKLLFISTRLHLEYKNDVRCFHGK